MQKARRRPKASTACRQLVSGTISLPCSGYFSPFPHGTSSLSVSQEYLALPDGSGRFTQNFTCSALLRILLVIMQPYVYGTITLYGYTFQYILLQHTWTNVVLQPQFCRNKIGLGYSQFARRYYGNHYCFLFLRVLRCFSSPGSPPKKDNKSSTCWVAPFGNFRIRRLFAPTRNLSQLITSFIASVSLGIRHTLLSNFFQLVKN